MNRHNKINKIAAAVSRGVTRGAEDLKLLARFYSGEAFHLYSGWSHHCGRYTLRSGEGAGLHLRHQRPAVDGNYYPGRRRQRLQLA